MGFFLPDDIYERLIKFLDGNLSFPFVREDEILGIFFLFGKKYGIKNNLDILSQKEVALKGYLNQKLKKWLVQNKK